MGPSSEQKKSQFMVVTLHKDWKISKYVYFKLRFHAALEKSCFPRKATGLRGRRGIMTAVSALSTVW